MKFNPELRKLFTPMIFVTLIIAYVMIMVLMIRDNNTLSGRRVMFICCLIGALVFHALYYTMIFNDQMWGTTLPKALCKGKGRNNDASCVTEYEQLILADNAVGVCLNIYLTWIIYKFYQQKKPKSEETLALTAINPAKEND